jgi:hypothetical protein
VFGALLKPDQRHVRYTAHKPVSGVMTTREENMAGEGECVSEAAASLSSPAFDVTLILGCS